LSDFALTKESLRRLRHQPQLGALIGLAERVAGDRARKPALRTDREAIPIDIRCSRVAEGDEPESNTLRFVEN